MVKEKEDKIDVFLHLIKNALSLYEVPITIRKVNLNNKE